MTNPNQICFYPEAGDTNSFGSSVAINKKYLAVGDPNANRVVIYQKDIQNCWHRSRAIYPPTDSPAYKIGNGFGTNIILHEDTLMIESISQEKSRKINFLNPKPVLFTIYLIDLVRDKVVTTIDAFISQEPGLESNDERTVDSIQFYILHEGQPKLIRLPNYHDEFSGISVATCKNLLLVGYPSRSLGGKGCLYQIDRLEEKILEINYEKGNVGDTVAVSNKFAAIGNSGTTNYSEDVSDAHAQTLIKSLNDGSTTIIDSKGYLSLDGDFLAITLPTSHHLMQSSQLQIFFLTENNTPRLMLERKFSKDAWHREGKYLKRAWLQNGWLIAVNSINQKGSIVLCLESIEQLISK